MMKFSYGRMKIRPLLFGRIPCAPTHISFRAPMQHIFFGTHYEPLLFFVRSKPRNESGVAFLFFTALR